jgi:hypothetical protein
LRALNLLIQPDLFAQVTERTLACSGCDAGETLNTTRWIEGHITEARYGVNAAREEAGGRAVTTDG